MHYTKKAYYSFLSPGTGSYPLDPPGRHRSNLFMDKNNPLNGPNFLMASREYDEQVG